MGYQVPKELLLYHFSDNFLFTENIRVCVTKDILFQGLNIPPMQAVGWEGVFGFSVLSVLLVAFYWIPAPPHFDNNARGTVEDAIDGLVQIGKFGSHIHIAYKGVVS